MRIHIPSFLEYLCGVLHPITVENPSVREEEAVGEMLDIIVPEKMRERHWEGYFRVMKTGVTKYGKDLLSVPGIRKDGKRVSLEFSVALIRDEDGVFLGVSAVMRDVTDRWQKEREMKERLAELESVAKGTEKS
jgi:PAS domain S-box-containing protein